MPVPSAQLRKTLLAAQVLDEVDLDIGDEGITLSADPVIAVRWSSLLAAAGGAPLGSARARRRIVGWLALRRAVGALPGALLLEQARPVGLPVGHALWPGPDWVRRTVLGGALQLGVGVVGLDPQRPDDLDVVPSSIWRAAGIDEAALWAAAAERLERMGALAAARWQRDGDVLRPMGGCDVVTLLGAASMRAALAQDAGGMRAVAVPMRTRGWTSVSRLDPAFAPAAARATDPPERGFERLVLVTADEVVLADDGPGVAHGAMDGVPEYHPLTA